jgi:hypoxanthine phosphoribosyltransferase
MRYYFVSWKEIEQLCRELAQKISSYKPDLIIALSRGGIVPARLISDLLIIKDIITIKVNHWGITATKDKTAEISYAVPINLSEKKVLVVDDITDTGESLSLAKKYIIENMKPKELKTATLYHIDHSSIVPDFFARELKASDWTWFVWPWNFFEDIKTILEKEWNGEPIETFLQNFNKKYKSNLSLLALKQTLEFLKLNN